MKKNPYWSEKKSFGKRSLAAVAAAKIFGRLNIESLHELCSGTVVGCYGGLSRPTLL